MRPLALVCGLALLGCASRGGCPGALTCGAATWIDPASGGTVEGRMVLAPMLDAVAARRAAHGSEGLTVSSEPTWMRFDLTGLVGAEAVERAVLSLAPHPRWRPSETPTARLLVRAAAGVQGASAVSVNGGVESEVMLASSARGPLRVDVTGLVRQWLAGTVPAGTLSLESTRGTAVFMGNGAMTSAERPRLEVVLR